MVQALTKNLTLTEFLQLRETKPASDYLDGQNCLKYETQMGWLIDPLERTVFVYRPKQQIEVFDEPDALIGVPNECE